MRTNKKKTKTNHPQSRTLKIYHHYRPTPYKTWYHVPEIRLCGLWLRKLGFYEGLNVTVTAEEGKLIVTLQPGQTPQIDTMYSMPHLAPGTLIGRKILAYSKAG